MDKQDALKKLRPKIYYIYGIFDFTKRELIYVSLDEEEVELQFDLGNYGEDFDIVCFKTMVN